MTDIELGDLLLEIAAAFYSLETVDDLKSVYQTLTQARDRVEKLRRERQYEDQRKMYRASRTVHKEG